MKWNLLGQLRSLRVKIMLSFLAFTALLLAWIGIYRWTGMRQEQIQQVHRRLEDVHTRFLESTRYLQSFLVQGFHNPGFYTNGHQEDIDRYQHFQAACLAELQALRREASQNKLGLDGPLDSLLDLSKTLTDSARALKTVVFRKGFKDHGLEGRMRRYAHQLEDFALVPGPELLMLRRHEKDYMLRGETIYATQFYQRMQKLLTQYQLPSAARSALLNYQESFRELDGYSRRLGIYTRDGLYARVQQLIQLNGDLYAHTLRSANTRVENIQTPYSYALTGFSTLAVGLGIWLSIFLSGRLVRDLTGLNRRMLAFVQSRFRDQGNGESAVTTTEIDQLNRHFQLLRNTLASTIGELEEAAAEARRSSEHKSSFLANMSHEIRTPLNGIVGVLHILKGTTLTAEQDDLVRTMDFSTGHLLEIIGMILDHAKIESGKIELEKIPFDLKGDLVKLIKLFEYTAREKGLTLELDYTGDVQYLLLGDPLRLQQILINLISNALKFTVKGGVKLVVTRQERPGQAAHVSFEVQDSGIGLKPGQLETLFEAFRQADSSVTRNFGGTGLGLTIAKQLAGLMGGELRAENRPTGGSVFYFQLELEVSGQLRMRRTVKGRQQTPKSSLRILLAEDNLVNQKVIGIMLTKAGHTVDMAENGLVACERYQQREYDLILMDVQMPEMDGMEATRRIKLSPRYKDYPVPVVAVTANVFSEDREKALAAGMDDFLHKPVRPEELESILAKFQP